MKLLNIIEEFNISMNSDSSEGVNQIASFSEALFVNVKMLGIYEEEPRTFHIMIMVVVPTNVDGCEATVHIKAIVNEEFINCIESDIDHLRKYALDSLFWAFIVADSTLYLAKDGKYHPQKFSYYAPNEM
jgi:hypothetical protein